MHFHNVYHVSRSGKRGREGEHSVLCVCDRAIIIWSRVIIHSYHKYANVYMVYNTMYMYMYRTCTSNVYRPMT